MKNRNTGRKSGDGTDRTKLYKQKKAEFTCLIFKSMMEYKENKPTF